MSRPNVDLGFFNVAEPDETPEEQQQFTSDDSHVEQNAISSESIPPPQQQPPPPPPPPVKAKKQSSHAEQYAPTVQEIESDSITRLADSYWKDETKDTFGFDEEVVETVWKVHLDQTSFSLRKVMMLEFSQYLEKYLWPAFVPKSAKGKSKSSLAHVLSIVVMVNEKVRQRVTNVWDIFENDSTKFSGLVSRILRLLVSGDNGKGSVLSLQLQRFLLIFLIQMFESLENALVRNECMRLVSISMWSCLVDVRREREFAQHPERRALWERAQAKFDSPAKQSTKEKMDFDRNFLSSLIKTFFRVLDSVPESGAPPSDAVTYCERFLELMIDLEAQLPTRRHFNLLMHDHLVVPICDSSALAKRGRTFLRQHRDISLTIPSDWGARGSESGALFVQLLDRLKYYAWFEIDDFTGAALNSTDTDRAHYQQLRQLQKLAFVNAREELEDFALANVGNVEKRKDLKAIFEKVEETTLRSLCEKVGIRTTDIQSNGAFEKGFLVELLISTFERRRSQKDAINALPLYPDEAFLFDETTVPATQEFSNTHCLAIPKLNLQFLTIHDYLLRNFTLFRLESTYEIRQDVEDVVKRLAPRYNMDRRTGEDGTAFGGWARMGALIDSFQVVDVDTPKLGETKPSFVKADVTLNISKYTDSIRKEWDALRPHDVLFLLTISMEPEGSGLAALDAKENGPAAHESEGSAFRKKFGLKYIRGCEVADLLGDDGRPVDDFTSSKYASDTQDRPRVTGFRRSLRVNLDPNQYQMDMDRVERKEEDVYPTFNILIRRKPQENNFKAVLDTIRDLMQSDLVVPAWLHNVFLGYGDRGSAHFTKIPNPVRTIDFRDTFLDYNHLVESFPGKRLVSFNHEGQNDDPLSPPFVLTFPKSMYDGGSHSSGEVEAKPGHSISSGVKRKLGENIGDAEDGDVMIVRTYKPENTGPYLEDAPKKNMVRFTPTQVDAIHAGTSLGLTMVVGPPGTGKTDVAVQIIANLYHNYPEQHTLIITHSNTALNQLFEKIAALDIDPRHILRLGHGQEELDLANAGSWGKYGRVNAFLEKRIQLLSEVDRLAQSLEIPGAHGHTCETAGYFYLYHILSRWEPYIHKVQASASVDVVVNLFPFDVYFADAPQPLFPDTATFEEAVDIAEGCWRHIKNMFDELEEIRAFELLRSGHDRSNYLLVKEAKIIAMTCTHAALKRREFVHLGFKYDNVVMEESGQILEVETFIPLLLQNPDPDTGASRLKRVVMIGDHNQLPPVVKNMAFQRYGNMEQSLFARFVRLGVPTIQLDAQGRARSSLAQLFQWKYENRLKNLPNVLCSPEYQLANPGFAFDYQAVNVPDFLGRGEAEPRPHFVQNLGEAEYVVATYQYMRLLGYPAEKISILTTYNGQKELIHDVLEKRCSWNPLFGNPHRVATVDKYQGQQNDYILLSLVRSKTVGHLRDVRRLIVAMSRARLGLYVFCRVPLFASCPELKPVFATLLQRPWGALWLRHKETYTAFNERPVDQPGVVHTSKKGKDPVWTADKKLSNQVTAIDGVERMGVYVQTLMQKQIDSLRMQKAKAAAAEAAAEEDENAMQGIEQ